MAELIDSRNGSCGCIPCLKEINTDPPRAHLGQSERCAHGGCKAWRGNNVVQVSGRGRQHRQAASTANTDTSRQATCLSGCAPGVAFRQTSCSPKQALELWAFPQECVATMWSAHFCCSSPMHRPLLQMLHRIARRRWSNHWRCPSQMAPRIWVQYRSFSGNISGNTYVPVYRYIYHFFRKLERSSPRSRARGGTLHVR